LEEAFNNISNEKLALETQMDECKELLKGKEEDIATLKDQMEA